MGFLPKSVRFILTVHTLFTISFCTFSHWINGYFSRFFGYFKPFLGFSRLFYILYYACQITSGKGKAVIDGETVELNAGDFIRVAPAAKRQFFAGENSAVSFVCIQVRENSLEGYTADDAVIAE